MLSVVNRGGHAQLFLESAIAFPQLEGSTSAITIPQLLKEMLLCNQQLRNSAIAIFLSVTSSPQLESFISAIFSIFLAVESGQFMRKKSEVKNPVQLSR
jgi:hypothetical protein